MLVAGMMAFLGPVATDLTASILKFFNVMNLEPRQYMTKGEIKLSRSTSLWGRAALGLATPNANGDGNVKINSGQDDTEMNASKSYGDIDNLLNLIPGMGAMVTQERNSGICFKFEHEYENNPKVPELDARMFSRSKIEVKMYTRSTLSVGLLGTFLQRLFLNSLPFVGEFFNAINFDRGVLLTHEVEMIRNTNVSNVTVADVRVQEGTTDIVENTDGSLQFINNQSGVMTIKAYTHLGMFSGDIEDLAAAGTEAKLKLSLVEIYKIYTQGTNYEFSFTNIKKLLLGFVYQKKVGLFKKDSEYARAKAQKAKHSANQKYTKKTVETFKTAAGTDNETVMLVEFFGKISQPMQLLDTAVALGIKIEVPFSSLLSILEFYLKKLYYRHTVLENQAQRNAFEGTLFKKRSEIESQVKARQKAESNNSRKTFYDYLFAVNNSYPSGSGTVSFKGLNGYIDDRLAENDPPEDFLDALGRFLQNPPSFDDFMQEITPKSDYDTKDIGINDFINYFTLLTDIMGLEIKIEGLLGVSGGASLKAGAAIGTAHLGLGGYAQLIYDAELYKDGQLTDLGINDPLRTIFTQLDTLLAKPSAGKKIPVRTLFDIVKD